MARSGGGGLPWKGAATITPGTSDQDLFGQYNHGTVEGDTDLVATNIRGGVTIFGVAGDSNVMNTQTATPAAASDIKSGKVAFANGAQIDGAFSQEVLYQNSDCLRDGGDITISGISQALQDRIIASVSLTLNQTSNVRIIAWFFVNVSLNKYVTMKLKRGANTLDSQTKNTSGYEKFSLDVLETSLASGSYTWDAVVYTDYTGNKAAAYIVAFSWVP